MVPADLQCAYLIFQALPDTTLDAIESFLTTIINLTEGQLALIEAEILSLNIILTPLLAKKAAVETVLATYESQAQILGSSISAGCPALGRVNESVQDVLSSKTNMIKRLLNEINRTQALRLQLQQYKAVAEVYINYLKRVRSLITSVKAARGAAIMGANVSPGSIIKKA
jgi:hypothetical protein